MINKRGFTLVELLAVITIIGIISLIAIPTVTKVVQNASDQVFNSNETLLATAAENYYKMNTSLLPYDVSDITGISLDTLIAGGFTKTIKNPKDSSIVCNGYVIVEKTDTKKYNYRPYLDCGDDMVTDGYDDYLYLVPVP